MGFLAFFGLFRRVKRTAFIIFLVAAVYAGPRFARDMFNAYGPDSTTTTTTFLP